MTDMDYLATPMEYIRAQRIADIISDWVCDRNVLEVGCGIGLMTGELAQRARNLTAMDVSHECISECINNVKDRHVHYVIANAERRITLPRTTYETVVAINVLEHVENPKRFMRNLKSMLKPGGLLVIGVPNAFSIHRQAGVARGVITDVHNLGPTDLRVGHKRVYDYSSLRDIMREHFDHVVETGSYYKPFPNDLMEAIMLSDPRAFNAMINLPVMGNYRIAADLIYTGEDDVRT